MRRLLVLAVMVGLLMPAMALAGAYDVIPAGSLYCNNTIGQNLPDVGEGVWVGGVNGAMNPDTTWVDFALGSKVFNMGYCDQMKIEGEILDAHGEIIDWPGIWISVGIKELSWINSDEIWNDPNVNVQGTSHISHRVGWCGTEGFCLYPGGSGGYGDYQTGGFRSLIEDGRRGIPENSWEDLPSSTFSYGTPQAGFRIKNDMSGYIPGVSDYSEGFTIDCWDPNVGQTPLLLADFPDPVVTQGIRQCNFPTTDPKYYNDFTDSVLSIGIVSDLTGYDGDVTYGDIELYVTGKQPGDANLDGTVNDLDVSLLAAAWQGTDEGWGEGDFTGDASAWGGLDGIVNDLDVSILAANWQVTWAPAEGNAVPEPSMLCLLALGALALVARRLKR